MAQRFIKAIGVASALNILLVFVSLIHRQLEIALIAEPNSARTHATKVESDEKNAASANDAESIDRSLNTTQPVNTAQSDPPALSVDVSLADEAPSVRSIRAQPPAKDDLLMAQLKKQAAEAMPATLAADPIPLVTKPSSDSHSMLLANQADPAKPKSALKSKSQALRELSAAADDLTELLQRLKEEGNQQQAQEVAAHIETLKKLMREML